MTDFRLKVFRSVAQNLSFTKASKELFVSQPAITKHIHELESIYQTRLFERCGNVIALTGAGKLLLEHCEKILDDYKRLEYDMHLLRGEYVGELKMGASTTIAQYVLPPLLADYISKFENVTLSLISGNSSEIETLVLENRIDLGLVEGISKNPMLRYTPFISDELVAVVRTDCRLPIGEALKPRKLLDFPLALRERGSGTLEVIEKALEKHNIKLSMLNVMMYLGSTESIKTFIERADCIGIVSVRSVVKELAMSKLRIVDIDGMPMIREFSFVRQQGKVDGLAGVFEYFALNNSKSL